mmetsp:Transcript_5472/g.11082  ORF Transcript_5472/g.11082 Transcript_5472/m.11082 type:complete len:208 (-) Transcript_5472:30-653(-)
MVLRGQPGAQEQIDSLVFAELLLRDARTHTRLAALAGGDDRSVCSAARMPSMAELSEKRPPARVLLLLLPAGSARCAGAASQQARTGVPLVRGDRVRHGVHCAVRWTIADIRAATRACTRGVLCDAPVLSLIPIPEEIVIIECCCFVTEEQVDVSVVLLLLLPLPQGCLLCFGLCFSLFSRLRCACLESRVPHHHSLAAAAKPSEMP